MLTGSYMVVSRKNSELGVGALLGVVVSQALGYGLVFDVNFFFRYLIPSHFFIRLLISQGISVSSVDY
jgi:SURF4 family